VDELRSQMGSEVEKVEVRIKEQNESEKEAVK
jgi:hypothetical protein